MPRVAMTLQKPTPLTYRILVSESNTPEWLRMRQCGVGASESAAILGETAWGSPRTVYNSKISDDVVDIGTDLMEFGHLAESILEAFMNNHPERFRFIGEIVESEGLLQSIEWPWLLGTLDRRIRTPQGFFVPLEFKSVNDHIAREWQIGGDEDDETQGLSRFFVPKKYQVQVQQQMAVLGAPFAYIGVWLGKARFELIRVERDEEFITEHLVGTVGDFWNFNVVPRVPPALSRGDDLWAEYPGERGVEKTATADVLEDIWKWRKNGVDRRDIKDERDDIEFRIVDFMGNATELLHPETGKVIHTLRGQRNNRSTNLALLEADYPDAYSACVKPGSWSRRHRPTKEKVDFE